MTTIFINVPKGKIFVDSQTTESSNSFFGKEKIIGITKNIKATSWNGYGIVVVGNVLASRWLKSCLYQNKNPKDVEIPSYLKKIQGGIILVRPGYCIHLCIEKGQVESTTAVATWVLAGSGAEAGICKCRSKIQEFLRLTDDQVKKCLTYNSLFDKYSDDEIMCLSPNEYL